MVPKKREQEKCQKTELRGEKLSEACVARRTCYCRGFVAAHRKIIKAIPQRMWILDDPRFCNFLYKEFVLCDRERERLDTM